MFMTPLVLEKIPYSSDMMVYSKLIYNGYNYEVYILPGMITDGASVPKLFQNIFPPYAGRYLESAVVHDGLYASEALPRKVCDDIFLEAMKSQGVAWWKRNIMYSAVRVAGWTVWNKHKPEKVKRNKEYVIVIEKDNYENN